MNGTPKTDFSLKEQDIQSDKDFSSEASSSEDEDGEEITEEFEKDWMCTLAALKTKDPKIYDKNVKFFQETGKGLAEKKSKKKTLSLQDVQRKTLITTDGAPPGDEKIRYEEDIDEPVVPSYYEEQEQLKKQFHEAASSIPDEEDILLKKSGENTESEKEEDYRSFLKGKTSKLKKSKKISHELSVLKDFWSKSDLDEGEVFLRDYILNKGYKANNSIPSYKDIIKDEEFSEDEEVITKQDNFEREYNFRFEEPDRKFIKCHPRKILDSVRIGNNARAEKRKATLERKKKEKEIKQEKLKRLKKQKRKEILEKIAKLKEVSGNDSLGAKGLDWDEDFDPEQHDQLMKGAFGENYYSKGVEDTEKPVFSDDDWEDEYSVDNNGDINEEPGCSYQTDNLHFEDPDFNMDADYDPTQHKSKKRKREKKKKQKQEKPKFNPDEMTFEEYFDEYYKLDYEDLIDDLPCRFQYRSVATNDFGLDTNEILHSTDKELNSWCPLSKVVQYRTEEEEFVSRKMYSKRSRQNNRKKNILTTFYTHSESSSSKTSNNKEENEEKVEKKPCNIKSDHKSNDEIPSVNSKQQKNSKKRKMSVDDASPEQNMASAENEENAVNKSKKKFQSKDNSSSIAGALTKTKSSKGSKNKTEKEGNTAKVSELSNTKLKRKKRAECWKQKQKGNKHNEQLNVTLSNTRLKAYGINPKKFKYIQLTKQK
ncbi:protein KRI1 homolog isoform X2 [Octopus bimaculoides]|uniref:protein KRI1 homolog isoform X2 n=1 Tax=Octopus bimaculoides TaxID=37653 RepID=UPI00071C6BDD|nr:protein KRI1 homolog isoform X2 [Octopus bimaculoides]|eukprot:XP_014789709.1 PREDICTED: protein KRI1 homolog isoform X2 [Octopus bimaculoides]